MSPVAYILSCAGCVTVIAALCGLTAWIDRRRGHRPVPPPPAPVPAAPPPEPLPRHPPPPRYTGRAANDEIADLEAIYALPDHIRPTEPETT